MPQPHLTSLNPDSLPASYCLSSPLPGPPPGTLFSVEQFLTPTSLPTLTSTVASATLSLSGMGPKGLQEATICSNHMSPLFRVGASEAGPRPVPEGETLGEGI